MGEEVHMGGVPVTFKEIVTRGGDRMAFVTFEDLKGSIEMIVFPNLYKEVASLVKSEQPLLVRGKVNMDDRSQKVKLNAEGNSFAF